MNTCIDSADLRHALSSAVPGSPLDFTRRVDVKGDKAFFLDRMTQPLPPAHDLRFVHRLPDGSEAAVVAYVLAWDSAFFGYPIARLEGIFPVGAPGVQADCRPALDALLDLAASRGVQYLFATIEARDIALLRLLGEAGFASIETRVYYHRALEEYAYHERYPVRAAEAADVGLLSAAARDTVNPYDRFHADPFISRTEADRLMCKWVEASVLEGFADITVVPDDPQPKAFCTVKYHRDKWTQWGLRLAQPVFSAVAPEFKGWYRKLISEISYQLKDLGAQHAYMTTQATNAQVIWTWESLGYRYGKTEHILRKILRPTPARNR